MPNRTLKSWFTGAVFSLSAAALAVPAVSVAGPGCMNKQRPMAGGYYPGGPMGPQGTPGYAPPPWYARVPNAAYQRPMPVYRNHPAAIAGPATPPVAASNSVASSAQAAAGQDTAAGERVTVRINGMRFEPENITIEPGTTVTWVHAGNMPHTISGTAGELRSATLYNGQAFSHTFAGTGRYEYVCDFHPSMKGSVIVGTAGRDT